MAASTTWNGSTGEWFDGTKWSNGVPGSGDAAVIAGGVVLLTNSTAELESLTVAGGTLVFSNWSTTLSASRVVIRGGTVTHALCNTNPVIENTNRVSIACGDLLVATGGSINVNSAGYRGGGGSTAKRGQGPGGGQATGGGSYGGLGAYGGGNDPGPAGPTYGAADDPADPGSGGGGTVAYTTTPGKPGGGAVRIVASGTVTVNGTITASAQRDHGDLCGSGSGGSIFISCRRFAGTNGWILAQGGGKGGTYWAYGGSGGGGRIAIWYDTAEQAQANITDAPKNVYISAGGGFYVNGGAYASRDTMGQPGTVYLSDASFYPSSNSLHGGVVTIPGFTSWTVGGLVLSNEASGFPAGFRLTVSNDLVVRGAGGGLQLTNSVLSVGRDFIVDANYYGYSRIYGGPDARLSIGRDLVVRQRELAFIAASSNGDAIGIGRDCVVTNGGVLRIMAAATNGVSPAYGALADAGGDIVIAASSWILPHSHPTNGGSVLFRTGNVRILGTNAGFNAFGLGFRGAVLGSWPAAGPGAGAVYAGGGYGGRGGYINNGRGLGGATYGDSNAPIHAGSGGGPWVNTAGPNGGSGGGAVRIEARQAVTVNGEINADGVNGSGNVNGSSAGGSGGGIYIRCKVFEGSALGYVHANGGSGQTNNNSGGGGGGRVAIWRMRDSYEGSVSASGGVVGSVAYTNSGLAGTVVWGVIPPPATIIAIR